MLFSRHLSLCRRRAAEAASRRVSFVRWRAGTYRDAIFKLYEARVVNLKGVRCLAVSFGPRWQGALIRSHRAGSLWSGHKRFGSALKKHEQRPPSAAFQPSFLSSLLIEQQQFSFWWTGVRPKGHTGLEKDWAAILGRLGLIQGRDGGARQPAERRAALL